jgi:hypothetical protein
MLSLPADISWICSRAFCRTIARDALSCNSHRAASQRIDLGLQKTAPNALMTVRVKGLQYTCREFFDTDIERNTLSRNHEEGNAPSMQLRLQKNGRGRGLVLHCGAGYTSMTTTNEMTYLRQFDLGLQSVEHVLNMVSSFPFQCCMVRPPCPALVLLNVVKSGVLHFTCHWSDIGMVRPSLHGLP